MFKNIDKVKKNIGETVFNHINSLSKTELEKQLSELKEELKSVNKDGGQRYLKLKDEEFLLLYRLERANEFKYKNGGGVGKDKVFEVAYYGKKHLKQRGSSKGNYKTWVVAINREEAIEKVKNDDDEFAELKSAKPTNLDVERYKMKTGGMVVTSIKDIPNFKKRLDEGKITYRGLGMGKLSDDFYDLAGETGSRIKVDGKEYFITNTEFDKFNRGKDGLMRIRFAAPYRKGYSKGGGIDINELNMPVIRTQFEDEEYEFKDGGEVESLKEGDYIWNALGKKLVVNKITNDIYYLSAFGQIGDSPFFKNNIEKKIATGQWTLKPKYEEGGTTKAFCYTIGGL